jgi:dTDP-4-amino-4,6-dideoxygalactose transaminase
VSKAGYNVRKSILKFDVSANPTFIAAESPRELLPKWPSFSAEEIEAATRVLESGQINYWTGSEGRMFEKEYAEFFGLKHAIALTNGTVAIELALVALDLQPGDHVVTTARTFIASASAAVMRGLVPVIADVDRDSGNITAETIERALTPRTKAIIVVHIGGWPCEMEPIVKLAKDRGIAVIEDCAQAHGATYQGKFVGSFGIVNAWSFCQDKILTTGGEGGMLTTDDERLWKKAWAYKDHGKDYDAVFNQSHPPGFRWVHNSFGTNWRLTEFQSALGRIQLRRLNEWLHQRRRNAGALENSLKAIASLRVPTPPAHMECAYYRVNAYVEPEQLKPDWSRDRIIATLQERQIPCFTGSCSEIYRERAFRDAGLTPAYELPVAKELQETSLAFLVHPTLQEEHMRRVADAVADVMCEASR